MPAALLTIGPGDPEGTLDRKRQRILQDGEVSAGVGDCA